MGRIEFLGCPLDRLDMSETIRRCELLLERPGTDIQVSLNAAKLVACNRDPELAAFVAGADLVNADGQSVVWGARLLGYSVPERVPGIDLMHELLGRAERSGRSIYVLGGREATLVRGLKRIRTLHPALVIAGAEHGYYAQGEEVEIAARIHASGADLLLLAMSSPRKEEFLARNRDRVGASLAMGVGGAVDILAGETRRAPLWMQRAGLEWLFRVVQEPRRMWRRYAVGNLAFVKLVVVECFRTRRRRPN